MKSLTILQVFFVTLVIVVTTGSASAVSELYAKAHTPGVAGPVTQTESSGPVEVSSSRTYSTHSVKADTSSDFGVLKLYAESMVNTDYGTSATSISHARWSDTFFFESEAFNGQAGTATMHFRVDGLFNINAPNWFNTPSGSIILGVGDSTTPGYNNFMAKSYTLYGDGTEDGSAEWLNSDLFVVTSFTYGTSFEFAIDLRLEAYTASSGQLITTQVTGDFSHTSIWQGITDIKNAGGSPVGDYSFSSSSGVNYINAVPEPTTTCLLAGGLILLVGLRRRHAA
jgi:hypothetical protein